jgi:prepilin-type N-terminal cleavage/methylation domain-containing protein/prepilin-type processing-associated H-X9-DG protein
MLLYIEYKIQINRPSHSSCAGQRPEDSPMNGQKKAFTLIELLVVIAVIAVLMGILMPALQRAREQGKATVCMSNMKQIGLAARLYAEDYDGRIWLAEDYPPGEAGNFQKMLVWQALYQKYVGGRDSEQVGHWAEVATYNCPSFPNKDQIVDYIVNAFDLIGQNDNKERHGAIKLTSIKRPGTIIYIADYENPFDGSSGGIQEITLDDVGNPSQLGQKLRWMDAYTISHLPYVDGTLNNGRRVAADRHGRRFSNCLYFDGHSDKVATDNMVPYDWGLKRNMN